MMSKGSKCSIRTGWQVLGDSLRRAPPRVTQAALWRAERLLPDLHGLSGEPGVRALQDGLRRHFENAFGDYEPNVEVDDELRAIAAPVRAWITDCFSRNVAWDHNEKPLNIRK